MNLEQYISTEPDGARTAFCLPSGHVIPVHPLIAQLDFDMQKAYAQAFTDAWADALNKQGEAAFVSTKDSAATHEAGHVVIATLDGYSITSSRIWRSKERGPFGSGWIGWTEAADNQGITIDPDTGPEIILKAARQIMAGYIAERVFEGENAREGSSLDEKAAALFLVVMAADGAKRDTAEVLHETELAVGRMLLEHKEQHRTISLAIAKAAPLKLKGKRLEALTAACTTKA